MTPIETYKQSIKEFESKYILRDEYGEVVRKIPADLFLPHFQASTIRLLEAILGDCNYPGRHYKAGTGFVCDVCEKNHNQGLDIQTLINDIKKDEYRNQIQGVG